ncbi:hypothetical protein SAMD00019534_002210 [Acytostelium subglobosum LB1]|uniref:hypothetical protein n=1 Tax=Acytostelium subglobosum LB1 TaxID=1410327 RepID=UPI000644FF76|nr:hypothetical protein SAMD00019534_002210 [Acytostelium subglobosum LB1]GAM17046.1 hypothetical protein SAMD00019534_002210 [Acytostelium subglobosum LB1]|eukprot:XP_012759108.1 hypothetical protein SAMD00019534_002210 [Acytostelium subglobosum LB1]
METETSNGDPEHVPQQHNDQVHQQQQQQQSQQHQQPSVAVGNHGARLRRNRLGQRDRRVKIIMVRASDTPGGLLRYDNSDIKETGLDLGNDKTLPLEMDQIHDQDTKSTPFSFREYISLLMGWEEVRSKHMLRAVLTELIGTAVFTSMSIGIVIAVVNYYNFSVFNHSTPTPGLVPNPWQAFFISAFHFFLLVIMIIACGPNSGGILNPIITLTTMITGFTTIVKGTLYICAQLVGAIIGSALIYACVPFEIYNRTLLASCTFGNQMSIGNALATEFLFGFFNLFITFTVALDPRQSKTFGILSAPLVIGITLFITLFISQGLLSYYAGPGFNISRCFGPAVVSGTWDKYWVFVVGPLISSFGIGVLVNVIPPFTYERWRCPSAGQQ